MFDHKVILKNLLDNLPVYVYWKDKQSIFLGCSENLPRLLGLNSSMDLVGKSDFETTTEKRAKKIIANDQHVIQTGKPIISEETVISKDGESITGLSIKAPFYSEDGEISGIIGITTDITDLKKTQRQLKHAKQEAEAANSAKTEFLENMRHSIRTPITGLLGLCDMIISSSNQAEVIELAQHQKAGINALLYIHNQVLEAVRVADGMVPSSSNKFNFKELITHVEGLGRPIAAQKKIDLHVDYDEAIPTIVVGDLRRLFRTVFELVSNALEFTSKGQVDMRVALVRCDDDKREAAIQIDVTDTGIGIPLEQRDDIFTAFKRLTPAYKGLYRGVGMGLSIIKQFMDDIGGEIYLTQSEVGKGSSFSCRFPVTLPFIADDLGLTTDFTYLQPLDHISSPKVAMNKQRSAALDSTATRILVVEDDAMAAKSVEGILTNHHCAVDIADTGEKALQLFKVNDYDLIFMDIGLPDMNGDEVTRHIRMMEWGRDGHVPILALSAHVDEKDKANCMRIGMDAVLIKPLASNKVESILQAFIPRRASVTKTVSALPATPKSETKPTDEFEITGEAIDLALGAKIISQTEKEARDMIEMYYESLKTEVPLVEAAYAKKDWALVQSLTHKMKGATSYLGMARLNQACTHLEQSIKASRTDVYERLYQQFLDEVAHVKEAYQALPPKTD